MTFELTLVGFDITNPDTQELLLWVKASSREKLDHWVKDNYPEQVIGVRELPWAEFYGKRDGIDFVVDTNPEDFNYDHDV